MLPDPLHPAIVHLPIALVILIPIFAFGALWAIHRGRMTKRVWGLPVALMALLVASAWLALETGEREEETVEAIVAESAIDAHEEAAEQLIAVGVTILLLSSLGLFSGRLGGTARWVGAAGSLVLLAAGVQVGRLGGELVYRHGAAAAYVDSTPGVGQPSGDGQRGERRERGDDDDRN
ncbi:MAG: hypothetical protein BMS9Abin29_0886 [Gemmatimonadota bacterium]|nr:MAG: hypothetical protein BMS9Abin29_0886 [Gemmatimonadota bacterium]